jgi:hypothetical protein
MKDLYISAKMQKTEIIWIVVSFCAAFLLNIISIIVYDTLWKEVYTQILWVLLIAAAFYALSVMIRVSIFFAKRLLKK